MASIQILLFFAFVSVAVAYGYDDEDSRKPSYGWSQDRQDTYAEPVVGAHGGFKVQGSLGTDWKNGGLFSGIKNEETVNNKEDSKIELPFFNIGKKISEHIGTKIQDTTLKLISGISQAFQQKNSMKGRLDINTGQDTTQNSRIDPYNYDTNDGRQNMKQDAYDDRENKYDGLDSTKDNTGNFGVGWQWDSNVDLLGKSTRRYARSVDFSRHGPIGADTNNGMPQFQGSPNGFPQIPGFVGKPGENGFPQFAGSWGGKNTQFADFKDQKGLSGFPPFAGFPGDKNQKGFPQFAGPWGDNNQKDLKGFPQFPDFKNPNGQNGSPQFPNGFPQFPKDFKGFPQLPASQDGKNFNGFPGFTGDMKGFPLGNPPNGWPNFPGNQKQNS